MPLAKLTDVIAFFEMTMREFREEWSRLSDEAKAEIREGIGNGTYTY
jgi:hypothetical protein